MQEKNNPKDGPTFLKREFYWVPWRMHFWQEQCQNVRKLYQQSLKSCVSFGAGVLFQKKVLWWWLTYAFFRELFPWFQRTTCGSFGFCGMPTWSHWLSSVLLCSFYRFKTKLRPHVTPRPHRGHVHDRDADVDISMNSVWVFLRSKSLLTSLNFFWSLSMRFFPIFLWSFGHLCAYMCVKDPKLCSHQTYWGDDCLMTQIWFSHSKFKSSFSTKTFPW